MHNSITLSLTDAEPELHKGQSTNRQGNRPALPINAPAPMSKVNLHNQRQKRDESNLHIEGEYGGFLERSVVPKAGDRIVVDGVRDKGSVKRVDYPC